jgi:hypothetical protein
MTYLNSENFKDYVGKDVEVIICCYEVGILYPDDNVLIGANSMYWYFYSKEEEVYWHHEINPKEKLNISIEVHTK